jgi:effector-binding domain-containing protein
MHLIERNQELLFENLFSCRLKATQGEINREMAGIESFLLRGGIQRSGPVITSVSSLELIRKKQILDFEILFPIDRGIEPTAHYEVKPLFHLVNALRLRHEGGRDTLPRAYNELVVYMISEGLQPITPLYNVTTTEEGAIVEDCDAFDVYVGVDPSVV